MITTSESPLLRSLLIYSICVPLAIFVGYLLAGPLDRTALIFLGAVFLLLTAPMFLRWHRVWLIASWNMGAVLFFLPGAPPAWMFFAFVSFSIAALQYILNPRLKFLHVPTVARPLIFLAVVVLVTGKLTGGFGLRSMGSEIQGGKRYVMLLGAIIAYFALINQRIPPRRVPLYVTLFFLGTLAQAVGELAPVVTPGFYYLFLIFPISTQGLATILHDPVASNPGLFSRLGSLSVAALGLTSAMLARYGIQDIFTMRRVGRLLIFLS